LWAENCWRYKLFILEERHIHHVFGITRLASCEIAIHRQMRPHSYIEFSGTSSRYKIAHIFGGRVTAIFDIRDKPPMFCVASKSGPKSNRRLKTRNRNERALNRRSELILVISKIGQRGHYVGLPTINYELADSYTDQSGSQTDFNPVGKFQIEKRFRGLTVATWWLGALLLAWLGVAYYAHERQSTMLALLAVFLLIAAIPGMFIFLLWVNGYLSETRCRFLKDRHLSNVLCARLQESRIPPVYL